MITVTLEYSDGSSVELWQDQGIHWASGVVVDALSGLLAPDRELTKITIDPATQQAAAPATTQQ